ncbi:hypothetical protein [Allopusillimonas ginsengisoli]|uniref:hypothetical protein n=1 Tax=Allopusillimonas ginsengisoli TaxID=453575 RepID=UPI001021978E|nr:hypothetical protein [Allopusillimonas ginsengisoli]TEA78643.1 hypothetical protein ERE07_09610 [Allopusillimonas ginsengisoli]
MAGQIITAEPGRVTKFHADDGKFHIQTIADVEPVLEHAKALSNEGLDRNAIGDRHLARIPIVVLNAWAAKRGVTFDAVMQDVTLLREFLSDPDHSHFRVYKGAI